MQFYKLNKEATLPTKVHKTDAGYDLYALEDVDIYPGELKKIKTGIAAIIPEGYVGLIKDRSSMGSKLIHVFAGVIDHGYAGDITVCLYNANIVLSQEYDFTIKQRVYEFEHNYKKINKGDKIAQLVVMPILCEEVEEVFELPNSERGEKGFGSSGK